jgi:hypothetical protein
VPARRVLCLLATLVALASPARAEPGLAGSVSAMSIDLERGLAESQGASAEAELHYGFLSGAYLGASLTSVQLDPDLPRQRDLAGAIGYVRAVSEDLTLRGQFAHYDYTGSVYGLQYDYDEARLSADYAGRLSASFAYSPDSSRYAGYRYAQHRRLLSYELAAREPLRAGFSLVAGLGYYDLSDLFAASYAAFNAGIGWTHGRFELEAGYYGVSGRARALFGTAIADSHLVLTATVRFRLCECGAAP